MHTTASSARRPEREAGGADGAALALVIAWCAADPGRVGDVGFMTPNANPHLVGRGDPLPDDPFPRIHWVRQRPGLDERRPPLASPRLSRRQLVVRVRDDALEVERLGKRTLEVDGKDVSFALLRPGNTVSIEDELVFLCCRRPRRLDPLSDPRRTSFDFARADHHGLVGEGPVAWRLRERMAFVGGARGHVLVLGPSGVGKELVARALHATSTRAARPFVARNAATLPATLIDAELFGHARDYPQPGMPERAGLLGQADGGTLFLDEIAEMPEALQAHLLRALDEGGDYQRLGEAQPRRSDFRLVAATNRAEDAIKHDLLARLVLRVTVPGLDERAEDVPLLALHLLRRHADKDARVRERFFQGDEPRLEAALVERLLHHRFTHHVRELDMLLWLAMTSAKGDRIAATPEVEARLTPRVVRAAPASNAAPSADDVRRALDLHGGNQLRAFRELGLRSRDQLYRLMKKYGIGSTR